MISSILVSAVEQAHEHPMEIPYPAWAYGVGALGGLMALLLLTVAFRSVRHRH